MALSRRTARRTSSRRWAVGVVLLLIAAGVAAYYLLPTSPPPPDRVAPVAGDAEPRVPKEAPPLPTEKLPPTEATLPPLAESDGLAREVAGTLTRHLAFAGWLANEGLVQRFVAAIDNVADGVSPQPHLGFLAPTEEFQVIRRGERVFIDPRSYARYDQVADVFTSLDAAGCADAYRELRPLLEQAYRELGRTDRTFEGALRAAIARVLATPVVEGEVELEPRGISYHFADPALEGRGAVEKQLLRMGQRNVRRIQEQLRLIAAALGMPS